MRTAGQSARIICVPYAASPLPCYWIKSCTYQELARPYQELPAWPYQELPLAIYQELPLASPCASQELPLASICGRGPRLRAEHCKLDLIRQKSWVTFMGGGDRRPKRAGLRGKGTICSGWLRLGLPIHTSDGSTSDISWSTSGISSSA
jgi:hypothetical protein